MSNRPKPPHRLQTRLTVTEAAKLLVIPRMHLNQLMSGIFEPEYAATLGTIMNLAVALADWHKKEHLIGPFERGQVIVARLLMDKRPPSADEASELAIYFDAADRFICQQRKVILAKAISYVERRLEQGISTSIADVAEYVE